MENFGAPDGETIENFDEIQGEINQALGCSKDPDLEFFFCLHVHDPAKFKTKLGRFGHACVAYRLGSGERILMNIVGIPSEHMVNFLDPVEYLFGTKHFGKKSEQGGIYNRSFCSVRIENLPEGMGDAIHSIFRSFDQCHQFLRFRLIGAEVSRWFQPVLGLEDNLESGNCSYWTSKALSTVRLLKRANTFPKDVLIELMERFKSRDPNNCHVVFYRECDHATKAWPEFKTLKGWCNPKRLYRNYFYRNIDEFADAVVHIPPATKRAVVDRCLSPKKALNPKRKMILNYGITLALATLYYFYGWPFGCNRSLALIISLTFFLLSIAFH